LQLSELFLMVTGCIT